MGVYISLGTIFAQLALALCPKPPKAKGKGCPINSKARRGDAGFYDRHFSISMAFEGGSYRLSVAALRTLSPKESSIPITAG